VEAASSIGAWLTGRMLDAVALTMLATLVYIHAALRKRRVAAMALRLEGSKKSARDLAFVFAQERPVAASHSTDSTSESFSLSSGQVGTKAL
jgi:hypothetical protein